jgi:predicted GNAT family N-acyltransferase
VLDIGVRCAQLDVSRFVLAAAIFRQEQCLLHAQLTHELVGFNSRQTEPIPANLREALLGFEAGKCALQVQLGSWEKLGFDARHIRTQVFIIEQGIPEAMEWDNADPGCIHAVAYNQQGLALATGRLIEHVPGVAKIGRMAVSQSARGTGVGRAVLQELMGYARKKGYREAMLHAQVSALPFYSRAGFVARGSVFDDVGIAHIEMVCVL